MSINFTWSVKSMHTDSSLDSHPNLVVFVNWKCEGEQDGHKITIDSIQAFAPGSSDSFIPYEQLTESQVLEWIFNTLDREVIEGSITQQFRQYNSQLIGEASLPW